jgi:hypothetical protein
MAKILGNNNNNRIIGTNLAVVRSPAVVCWRGDRLAGIGIHDLDRFYSAGRPQHAGAELTIRGAGSGRSIARFLRALHTALTVIT